VQSAAWLAGKSPDHSAAKNCADIAQFFRRGPGIWRGPQQRPTPRAGRRIEQLRVRSWRPDDRPSQGPSPRRGGGGATRTDDEIEPGARNKRMIIMSLYTAAPCHRCSSHRPVTLLAPTGECQICRGKKLWLSDPEFFPENAFKEAGRFFFPLVTEPRSHRVGACSRGSTGVIVALCPGSGFGQYGPAAN